MKQETKQTVGSNSVTNLPKLKIDDALDLPLAIIEDTEDGDGVAEIGERTDRNLNWAKLIVEAVNSFQALKDSNRELIEANKWLRGALEEAVNADCVYETNPALLELFNAALQKAKQLQ